MIELKQGDCLELMKTLPDNSIDLIFCDPPYALGSEVIIKPNGKPDYKKAVDFMNKWDQPDGTFWEEWFTEAKRVLKHGGHCLMFGMDRQLWFNCYYANYAGFTQKQSLYWYFISNFPKASDLSKNLDKYFFNKYLDDNNLKTEYQKAEKGMIQLMSFFNKVLPIPEDTDPRVIEAIEKARETNYPEEYKTYLKHSNFVTKVRKDSGAYREVVGKSNRITGKSQSSNEYKFGGSKDFENSNNITAPSTHLAKKYESIKYSVAPLKQVVENIMVFQKPYKTGSCLHDVLAMENGDDTITCGGVDIEGNRVEINGNDPNMRPNAKNHKHSLDESTSFNSLNQKRLDVKNSHLINADMGFHNSNGRFPAQTYIDTGASEIIDLQSGILKSGAIKEGVTVNKDHTTIAMSGGKLNAFILGKGVESNSGGASRILHKCDYDKGDYDLYHYCPKVSKEERNEGLEGFEEKQKIFNGTSGNSSQDMKGVEQKFSTQPTANNHPTVKPKALLFKILKLFKTPNQQVILDPFMGSGSMGISAVETDFDYIGYELDPEYFKIAEARIANTQSKAEQRLL
jgi:DNA modification methylase